MCPKGVIHHPEREDSDSDSKKKKKGERYSTSQKKRDIVSSLQNTGRETIQCEIDVSNFPVHEKVNFKESSVIFLTICKLQDNIFSLNRK